jgi:CheY-like chemotaxis protein
MLKIELESLKTIKGLSLPDVMGNKAIGELNYELDEFIETLPSKTYELTKLLIVRDYDFLLKKLNDMGVALNRIYAEDARQSYYKLIEIIRADGKKSQIDILLENFISELSTLSIDIQLAQHKSQENKQTSEKPKQDANTRKNILAVDDEPVILNTLKKVIDNEKYKFSGAVSGKTALKYLETHILPDLIILDIDMPEMNGYELAANIKDKGYGIPVIFLTSNATREHVMKALDVGASDFLVKPVNENLILSKLDKFLI